MASLSLDRVRPSTTEVQASFLKVYVRRSQVRHDLIPSIYIHLHPRLVTSLLARLVGRVLSDTERAGSCNPGHTIITVQGVLVSSLHISAQHTFHFQGIYPRQPQMVAQVPQISQMYYNTVQIPVTEN